MVSYLIFYPSLSWAASFPIPFALGSLNELYVRTPIAKYMEAFEGWAIILPNFKNYHHGGPYSKKTLLREHQRASKDSFFDGLLLDTESPIPLCLLKVGGESYALFLRRPDVKVSTWIHMNPMVDRCATSPSSLIQLFLLPPVGHRRHRLATPIRPRIPRSTCNTERHLPTTFA